MSRFLTLACVSLGLGPVGFCACGDDTVDPVQKPNATGGVTNHGGAAGAGGGAGATGATGGVSACAPGNTALIPEMGFIQDSTTGYFGAWYTFGCPGSDIDPKEAEPVPGPEGRICFSGSVPAAVNGDFAVYYGAVVGFDVCAMPADMSTCTDWMPPAYCGWDPGSKHTVAECGLALGTISFEVTGTPPPELRVVFKEQDREENPYLLVNGPGCFSGEVASATVQYRPTDLPLDPTRVESIHFQVATDELAPVSFDFCISELSIE